MNRYVLSGLICAALLALPQAGLAHGGQYRGPGDVVPPNPGGSGGRTPGPSGPTTPGPSGPTTPGPAGPSTPGPSAPTTGGPAGPPAPGGGPKTPRGVETGPDLTRWQFWWEFNKDPYLNLKEAVQQGATVTGTDEFFLGASKSETSKDTLKPSEKELVDDVLPALKRALDGSTNRDITSSCMVAMAKIGKNNKDKDVLLVPTFEKHLKSADQEIRETAALAIGLSWMPGDADVRKAGFTKLSGLILDNAEGRKLVERGEVDDRTRSFATYGLALTAYASTSIEEKVQAFEIFKSQVLDEKVTNRNNKVAAINAIRLLRVDASGNADEKHRKLLEDAINVLWGYYDKKLGKGENLIQAHCPPAIATLIGRGNSKVHQRFKDAFLKDLDVNRELKNSNEITQSCAISLGLLCDRSKEDEKYLDGLIKYAGTGKDEMSKYYSLIALGEIGGDKARAALIEHFQKGSKATVKPWAAIALGVLGYRSMRDAGQNATVDLEVGRTLHSALKEIPNPETREAIAIGLGLLKYTDAADDIREMLIKGRNQEELAGYLSIGLALMGDRKSIDEISGIVKQSLRRPDLLKAAAIALGKLGDKSVTATLEEMLTSGDMNVAKLSAVATAFGFIGDKRTISPLVKLLFDDKLTELSRAFAAVALGGVADKELLPWNSKIACDMNYRAAVETLTNQLSGILDIL